MTRGFVSFLVLFALLCIVPYATDQHTLGLQVLVAVANVLGYLEGRVRAFTAMREFYESEGR